MKVKLSLIDGREATIEVNNQENIEVFGVELSKFKADGSPIKGVNTCGTYIKNGLDYIDVHAITGFTDVSSAAKRWAASRK
ncbi:hypothetical protein ACTFR8_24505 [Bacillus cereus group sp. MYBK15-3]|uniref:hypothetical protein n=1 Tax=Bacillus cereus group TaxID=86661 RepID=UPI00187A410D|nr:MULTISPECIES: hypothetical protein [Bacillus cereus group]MBE7114723.1 hypothetical protein [Bacillus paranthracis]MBE7154910.1 hypothetical protein [Bacillus paranthracis]MBX9158762.1 hypothetical protein [Bacillus cereus]